MKNNHKGKFIVYKLLNLGEVCYVGQTTSLDLRVIAHRKDKTFDEIWYTEVETREIMNGLEAYLIHTLIPVYNKTLNLQQLREYTSRKDNNQVQLEWNTYYQQDDLEGTLHLINNYRVCKHLAEQGLPKVRHLEVNMSWYLRGTPAISSIIAENGEPYLRIHPDYSENLFRDSLMNIMLLEEEDLESFTREYFSDVNLGEEAVYSYLAINCLKRIVGIYQKQRTFQ